MNGAEEKPREGGWGFQQIAMILLLGSGIGGLGNWAIPDRGVTDVKTELREIRRELEKLSDDMYIVSSSYHGHIAVSDYWVDRIRSLEKMHSRSGRGEHPQLPISPKHRLPQE